MSLWSDRIFPHIVERACRSREIADERRRWIPRAHGEVLEIGAGTGLNFAFYDPARAAKVTAIDPAEPLLARAAARARTAPLPIELRAARAEELPFADASFDSAVITYTLCSVEEPRRALAEIRRVLRPSGELYFVEHGLAPDPAPRRWQRLLTPAWRRVGGGCRLDRDVVEELREAGFVTADLRAEYGEGPRWLSFTYEGSAH